MGTIPLNRKQESVLNDFIKKYRERTLAFLNKYFQLSKEDCEDVFQEASIRLFHSALEGKLDNLSSSLYTYFIGICKNKAHEQIRTNNKILLVSLDNHENDRDNEVIVCKAEKILQLIDENEKYRIRRQKIVQDIVKQLPSPCNELLWAYYRDALSMETIACMFGYANPNTVKVTKHRCMEKFSKKYSSLSTPDN